MSKSVNFTELFEPTFSTTNLIPISILTNGVSFAYAPGASASGDQLADLFALAAHLTRDTHATIQKVIIIGDHGTLLAKILLNMSSDYIVDTIVKSLDEQQAAYQYVNNPNLFKCFYFGDHLVTTPFAAFPDYDIAVFTDLIDAVKLPTTLTSDTIVVMRVVPAYPHSTPFDAYDSSAATLAVSRISTLVTGTNKIFTISGTARNV